MDADCPTLETTTVTVYAFKGTFDENFSAETWQVQTEKCEYPGKTTV
jgi:hypothetical protein